MSRLRDRLAAAEARVAELEVELEEFRTRPTVWHCAGGNPKVHDLSGLSVRANALDYESDLVQRERMLELQSPAMDRERAVALGEMHEAQVSAAFERQRELSAEIAKDRAEVAAKLSPYARVPR